MKKIINLIKIHPLLFAFFLLLIINIPAIFLMNGPFIYPDEPGVFQRALYFINNFEIGNVREITGFKNASNPTILYSIVISPIYHFFYGFTAYYSVLLFNTLLISSLIFPIFKIVYLYTKKRTRSVLFSLIILLSAPVVIYEKLIMTEVLFIFLSIWILYFYIFSFVDKKKLFKGLAIILSLLAIITRPFGFVYIVAITLNEIIVSRKKYLFIFILILLSIFSIYFSLKIQRPEIARSVSDKFSNLYTFEGFLLIFKSLKNQLNSLSIGTLFIPFIYFLTSFYSLKNKHHKKYRWFIILSIFFIFIISAQHIFGYLINGNDLNLLSRYINIPIILVILFGIIIINNLKSTIFTKKEWIISAIILFAFLLLDNSGKYIQNIILAPLYTDSLPPDFIIHSPFLFLYLLPFLILIVLNKHKKVILYTFIISTVSMGFISNYFMISKIEISEVGRFFASKQEQNLHYILSRDSTKLIDGWKILSLSSNHITHSRTYSDSIDANYIISEKELDLQLLFTINPSEDTNFKTTYIYKKST